MLEIVDINQQERWDEIVTGFPNYDVYYLSGYVIPFMHHGDGRPKLLYYNVEGLRAIYVFMVRDTDIEDLYDSTTPYGYGGILFDGDVNERSVATFWNIFSGFMQEIGIVDDFVRYHPVLGNAEPLRAVANVTDLGRTVALDLSSPEVIWENLTSKKRGKIRKAQKNGIQIFHGQDIKLFKDFIPIYDVTMDKDNASGYYYFDQKFFELLHEGLRDHYEMFYAMIDGKIIMMAIMLYCNGQMHYHLSGSLPEYRNLEPNNLLLYEAALWGCEKELKTLHLGGGVGSGNDSLFEFKKGFNRNADLQFSIGRHIFDQAAYDQLVKNKKNNCPGLNLDSAFFPLYMAEE